MLKKALHFSPILILPYLFEIKGNIIFPIIFISSNLSLYIRFPSKSYVNFIPQFFFYFPFFIPLAHPILHGVNTLKAFYEKYKSRNTPPPPGGIKFSPAPLYVHFVSHSATAPSGTGPPHYLGFNITIGRNPMDEWSARRLDRYLTTHNTQNNIHAPSGIRTHNPSKRATADSRLIPCSH